MKMFCIWTEGVSISAKGLKNCVKSAEQFGYEVSPFKSIHWKDLDSIHSEIGLKRKLKPWKNRATTKTHCPAYRLANGTTHYLLYQKCLHLNEPICILEHDAIFVKEIPEYDINLDCYVIQISSNRIGRSLGQGETVGKHSRFFIRDHPETPGIHLHPFNRLIGTSGYIISPKAASRMIHLIEKEGVANADRIFERHVGPLFLFHPQPVETQFKSTARMYFS